MGSAAIFSPSAATSTISSPAGRPPSFPGTTSKSGIGPRRSWRSWGWITRNFPFIRPGDVVGPVAKEISRKLGFGTPPTVIAGGPDFLVSILGTGTVTPGRACDRAGTSEGINLCSREKIQDDRLMCYGHVIPGYHNISGIISTSGKAVEWVRKMLGLEGRSYEEFFDLARDAAPGSGGFSSCPIWRGNGRPYGIPVPRGCSAVLPSTTGPPNWPGRRRRESSLPCGMSSK